MIVYVLRKDAGEKGTAYPKLKDVKQAALDMSYGEIVRADLPLRGAALYCALFNRDLGPKARVIGFVDNGQVMILNNSDGQEKAAPEVVPAAPY